jgi:hypothetical protein
LETETPGTDIFNFGAIGLEAGLAACKEASPLGFPREDKGFAVEERVPKPGILKASEEASRQAPYNS